MRVLVVEDIPEMGELIRTTLEGIPGVEVRVVHTVLEARRALLKNRPDWLFLDEIIPGEYPYELLTEPAIDGVQVVLITAAYVAEKPLPRGARMRMPKWGWNEARNARARIAELLNRG